MAAAAPSRRPVGTNKRSEGTNRSHSRPKRTPRPDQWLGAIELDPLGCAHLQELVISGCWRLRTHLHWEPRVSSSIACTLHHHSGPGQAQDNSRCKHCGWATIWATYLRDWSKPGMWQSGPQVQKAPKNSGHPSERRGLCSAQGSTRATSGPVTSPGSLGSPLYHQLVRTARCRTTRAMTVRP